MCGIAGFSFADAAPVQRASRHVSRLRRMTAALYHRGPDAQTGVVLDGMALGHSRLAIVDLEGGRQPMTDPETGNTVVFNGEVFNHSELREQLGSRYRFSTRSDTEVILAAYRVEGIDCVQRFIGQFAFALWDARERCLWLCRDRVGIRPLYYRHAGGELAFASEIKALIAGDWVEPSLDLQGIAQCVTLWAPLEPRTCFSGVSALPPGCVARLHRGELDVRRYWDLEEPGALRDVHEAHALDRLTELLEDSVRLRLRADVPVAAYLSGGLDSSVICALAQAELRGTLHTFSVGFEQPSYDERAFQEQAARALGTRHTSVLVTEADTAADLPAVVAHAEQVLLRAAPAPMYRLSRLVREHATKVVLTGEGADEILLGYDLFKEAKVRAFCARRRGSVWRPALFRRLYPYLSIGRQSPALLAQVFDLDADPAAPDYSHRIRWSASGRIGRLFSPETAARLRGTDPARELVASLPARVRGWSLLGRAQYLEMRSLLAGYLLSAQGDRMAMAHSVEGRFPFLDHRLVEFATSLPERLKLRVLCEKYLLRKLAASRLPALLARRTKHPYRAPLGPALVRPGAPAWAAELLSADALRTAGIFDPDKVRRLFDKIARSSEAASESDSMAVMAIASTQLLWDAFRGGFSPATDRVEAVEVRVP